MIIPVITGPTASGKSDLLYRLFESGMDFEIVSADAFQVYKGLDIGTAKPTREILSIIPHHLIDIIPPDGSYAAGDFAQQAEPLIEGILKRNKLPILSGGTGLYIQSLRDGLFDAPPANPEIRAVIRRREETEGRTVLFKELESIDPSYAAKIHENDMVRIVRALEIWYTTGIPLSEAHNLFHRAPRFQYKVMVIDRDRDSLYGDINARVSKMLRGGWINEVESLLNVGITTDMPSFRAIGYRELAAVLGGNMNIKEAEALIAQKTRNYAKRQMTWFRGMENVQFMSMEDIRNAIEKAC